MVRPVVGDRFGNAEFLAQDLANRGPHAFFSSAATSTRRLAHSFSFSWSACTSCCSQMVGSTSYELQLQR